jgi:two-component system nitrate/nitrite response regulator NarL
MTSRPLRIVVADDHEPTRIGLRVALEDGGWDVPASAWDTPSAVSAALRERPDVCLLDVVMPGGGGLEGTRRIKAEAPEIRVVLLSAIDAQDVVLAGLRAGADGFLSKDMGSSRLSDTLRGVVEGEAALPRRLVGALIGAYQRGSDGAGGGRLEHRLTAREREVLDLLLEEAGTGEIAYRLGLNAVTVRRHISGIVRKSGAADRISALRLARAERARRAALERVHIA